jgi:hypothetical protein
MICSSYDRFLYIFIVCHMGSILIFGFCNRAESVWTDISVSGGISGFFDKEAVWHDKKYFSFFFIVCLIAFII